MSLENAESLKNKALKNGLRSNRFRSLAWSVINYFFLILNGLKLILFQLDFS